uniref:Uncharacterized protein n=1 Tax=Candidatus Kentrum sp. LFY TaxID=2126342 RepID=A0A450UMC4_9GAMM|nr:MAG: hypothetical protein BECKLFY1418B_GA0070995_10494 [Candidatus Kentron sp. LFY]VFJ93714.1 MAG: hypothetical protein BECKLFY1418A_GA0070994_103330 [Candidatus Kentron sp. LFY]
MTNAKITEKRPWSDDEEREIIEELEKALEEGTLLSQSTPERGTEP